MAMNKDGTWNPGFDGTMGGGFLNNTNIDSSATKKKETVRRLQSVVPVTVRMIRDSHDDESETGFSLFGMPAQIVCVVGFLTKLEIQSTKATYRIQDHTGTIKAVWWVESDVTTGQKLPLEVKEGTYLRVYGTIRTQDGEKTVMVLKMSIVDDCNILTMHLLEVINTRLQAEVISKESAQMIKLNNPGASLASSMTMYDENVAQNGQGDTLTNIQQKIFSILQGDQSQAGPDRASILAHFAPNVRKQANEALEYLVNEGHAYTTIDDDHFKSTEV